MDALYRWFLTAGTHIASNIKEAEVSKVIENSQRDINIAFVNELAKIFNRMDIDTHVVLEAGYHPEIILAGRRMNDSMGAYVASEVVKLMIKTGKPVKGARALMQGITFKENCPDIRNTRAIDIWHELTDFGMTLDVYAPKVFPVEVMQSH